MNMYTCIHAHFYGELIISAKEKVMENRFIVFILQWQFIQYKKD